MDNLAAPFSVDDALSALAARPDILRLDEAADALGVSTSTLRRRIRSGDLRALRTSVGRGGRLRILKRDLAALLAGMGP